MIWNKLLINPWQFFKMIYDTWQVMSVVVLVAGLLCLQLMSYDWNSGPVCKSEGNYQSFLHVDHMISITLAINVTTWCVCFEELYLHCNSNSCPISLPLCIFMGNTPVDTYRVLLKWSVIPVILKAPDVMNNFDSIWWLRECTNCTFLRLWCL